MHDPDVSSATQDSWVDIADLVRRGLAKAAAQIPNIEPKQANELVVAMQRAMYLERSAATYDRDLELRAARQHYED